MEPKPTVVVTFSRPAGFSLLSVSSASVIASLANTSRTVRFKALALLGQDQAARMAVEQRHLQAPPPAPKSAGKRPIG